MTLSDFGFCKAMSAKGPGFNVIAEKRQNMKANMAPFLSLLGASNVLYMIPVYQRKYAWDEEDCRVLWDDIIRAGKQGKPHFIGSVLHIPEGESTITGTKRHLLIDGQQRMTTMSLLLEAFIEYLEEDPERRCF